jgi:hypothetical protein
MKTYRARAEGKIVSMNIKILGFLAIVLASGSSAFAQQSPYTSVLFTRSVADFAALETMGGLYGTGQFLPNGDLFDVISGGRAPWQNPFTSGEPIVAAFVPGDVYPDGTPRVLAVDWYSPVSMGSWNMQIYPDAVYPNGQASTYELDFAFSAGPPPVYAPEIDSSGAVSAFTLLLGGLLVLRGGRTKRLSVPISV